MYLDAFSDLQTMRLFEGGPIPFDKMLWYAVDILCLEPELVEIFTAVIREMDMVYQEWQAAEREKGKPKSPSSQGGNPKPGARPPRARRPSTRRR